MFLLMGVLCLVGCVLSQDAPLRVDRLSDTITPLGYIIRLHPDMDTNTVTGSMMIQMNTTSNQTETLDSITMHLGTDSMLNEDSVKLMNMSGKVVKTGGVMYDDYNSLVKILLPDGVTLSHGSVYQLSFQFMSKLYSVPKGLFTGSFNSTSKYVAAYFRPTYARDVFPCFDEPHYKVPVSLQVIRPADFMAFSTAPLVSSSDPDENNMVLDTFQKTSPISIHSLGLFISQVQPVDSMGVNLFITQDLPSYVPYLDSMLSIIRSDIGSFSTEPMNLVVLSDLLHTSFSTYGFVFTSPEVYTGGINSTMKWFSCKLQLTEAFLRQFLEYDKTPQWWSDLWLSESISAYLATTIQPESLYPDWLKIIIRSEALGRDFIDSGCPVVNNQPLSKWDIEDLIANKIIRNKGLSVLTMWNDTMPVGLVNKTILDYIKLQNKTTITDDWCVLMVNNILADTTYNATPAINQIQNWLNSSAFPVVTYSMQNATDIVLSQSPSGSPGNTSMDTLWPISISYTTKSSQAWENYREDEWLVGPTMEMSFPDNVTQDEWMFFNLECADYRTQYNDSWGMIIEALKKDLTPSSGTPVSLRAMLQDDAVALSLVGSLPFSTSLTVLSITQRDQLDWFPVAKALKVFSDRIGNDNNGCMQMQMFANLLVTPDLCDVLDLLHFDNNTDQQYARALLTPLLCKFDLCNCREAVVQLNQQLLQGNTSMMDYSDLENVACLGARHDSSVLDTLLEAYINASSLWLKSLFTIALGCLSDPPSVQTVLNNILSANSSIETCDAKNIMVRLSSTLEISEMMRDYLVNNSYDIQQKLGVDTVSAMLRELGRHRIDMSPLVSLTNVSLGLDPYVMRKAEEAMLAAKENWDWWTNRGPYLLADLPQPPTTSTQTTTTPVHTTQTSTPQPTPSPTPPSSAKSLLDFRVFSLVATAAITVLAINF